jgi:GT2 family glycosyltransferase
MSGSVTAVVVRWRGGDEVNRCLRSLLTHGGPPLDRVILVDSGSGDRGPELIAKEFSDLDVLALPENLSFAWAANQGAALGTSEFLLQLNPDTELRAGVLESLVGFLVDNPSAAGAVPILEDPGGRSQHRWQLRRLPEARHLAVGRPGPAAFSSDHPDRAAPVSQPAASAWLVRSTVWRALDGLDSGFAPAWWEDVDFCARLARSILDESFPASEGFFVIPGTRVLHTGGSSLAGLSDAEFLTIYHQNLLRYASLHLPDRLAAIHLGLRLTLRIRALRNPSRRRAYLDALRAIR